MGENPPIRHVLELPNEHIDIQQYELHLDYGPLAESITTLSREYIVVQRREMLKGNAAEDAERYLDSIINQCGGRHKDIEDWEDAPRLVYRPESTSQFETSGGAITRMPKAVNVYQKICFDQPLGSIEELEELLDCLCSPSH